MAQCMNIGAERQATQHEQQHQPFLLEAMPPTIEQVQVPQVITQLISTDFLPKIILTTMMV